MFLDEGCFPLSFMERSKRHKHANTTKKEFVFGPEQPQPYRKTILLIGPKGSGKTALVNSFANFVNNVTTTAPYRLHITPVNEKANSNSSMNYAPTHSVSTYVFQNTPLGFPIALVDTPSIGVVEEQSPSVEHIKTWIETDYQRPIEDLEIWFVISAVDSDFSSEAEEDLQVVLDAVEWKSRVIPVITFAKKRKPILAQRELTRLGFRCEHEGVDYFTINNGSILGLSTELLEINAVPYDIGMENLRSLVLSHREPELMPLHISTNEGSLKFSTGSTDSDQSNETLSTPSTSPVKVVTYDESPEVDRSTPLNTPEPVYDAPQPILSAHTRFKSCDSEKASLVKKREVVAPLQKEKMRSTDCIVDEKKTLPSYEKFLKEIRKDKSRIDPLKRCQSEDGLESDIVRRKFGFVNCGGGPSSLWRFGFGGDYSNLFCKMTNPFDDDEDFLLQNDEMAPNVVNSMTTLNEDEEEDEKLEVPQDDPDKWFSFRTLWAYTGPGFLMSIAYLDPGNIESDLQSGAKASYKLLWVLLYAHIIGLFLQRMSARLGVVTGKDMAEIAYNFYPVIPRCALWLMIEVAIVCSDMQEVIGTAIALHLLTATWLPLWVGVLVTLADTLTFLSIERQVIILDRRALCGYRKLELFFGLLITTMAVSFGVEYFIVEPNYLEVAKGVLIPWCKDCGREQLLLAVSVVGAVIMPHNLYLHSALVKTRRIDRRKQGTIEQANKYYVIESAVALTVSFIINLFVVSVFAHGLYGKTNHDVHMQCNATAHIPDRGAFPDNDEPAESDIYKGGIFLGCQFGIGAMYIWAVGILAAGQSSTMTGTYAGQYVMEGFIRVKWPKWLRVMVTRSIAIGPTILLTLLSGDVHSLTGMNDLLNCVQMVQLPFALIPIITFTSSERIMHNFKSSKAFQFSALLTSLLVIAINIYFVQDTILEHFGRSWYVFVLLIAPTGVYFAFIVYLLSICLFECEMISKNPNHAVQYIADAPWLGLNDMNASRHPQATA
ncbi:smf-1 [Pristionchus pacificus]|uniref:Smf-1 n=1 Tax=Pristionchus pacificus TaxID=54126 RepID=A0A2A6D269_PRIPA|nr:smf-1 [Pristionchus pacificus]|eukprot:PDM84498.1 smf-1 [Pristionchus pacificus]